MRLPELLQLAALLLLGVILWRRRLALRQRNLEDHLGERFGCQRIQARVGSRWPLGLDFIVRLIVANNRQRLLQYYEKLFGRTSLNFEQHLRGDYDLVSLDPENVKAVLSRSKLREGEFDFVYGKRRPAFFPMLGEGIFTQDGAAWKQSRDILRRQFSGMKHGGIDGIRTHVELLLTRLRDSQELVVDLQPLFFNYTLDTTTALLFGKSAGSLAKGSDDYFSRSFNLASWASAVRIMLIDLYWLYNPPSYVAACKVVKRYAEGFVDKALQEGKRSNSSNTEYPFIRALHRELQSRVLVRDQLINVLLAGRDTTACCLSWAMRLLIRHPEYLAKLQSEIKQVLGDDIAIARGHMQRMTYLRDVLTETLRLYPSVPINLREAKEATILPRGGGPDGASPVLVRKGMGFGWSPYFMHRREELYGPDAHLFRPERWSDGTLMQKVGWGYLPFNAGPRVCLGQEFALLEAAYAIARIVQEFPALSLPDGEEHVPVGQEKQIITLTIAPADGCRVVLR